MKKKNMIIIALLLFLGLMVGSILLHPASPTVKNVEDTLTFQQHVETTLKSKLNQTPYSFDNPFIEVNPYGNSPLTALIAFTTPEATSVSITIKGKDEKSTFYHEFSENTEHLIPIYGLYPDTTNEIILRLEQTSEEHLITLQTDPLPSDFITPSYFSINPNIIEDELYFFTPSSAGYTAAYDLNGDVRWYLTTKNVWEINRLNNGHLILSSDRTVNAPYYMAGLMEMDLLGKIYAEYVFPGGYHHDVYELPSGNFIVAGNNPDKSVVEDYVLEISRQTGKVLKEWDIRSILPTTAGKSENWTEHDWFHNNSVYYDQVRDALILSGRHQDAVISIDYQTNDLNWIIGDPTNWPEEMQPYFFTPIGDDFEWQWSQHSAKVLPNGDIFIFDNGNNRSKHPLEYVEAKDNYSRGVIYRLNEEDMTIEQIFEFGKEQGSSFYSPYISEVDYLGPEHYLIHSGGIVSLNGIPANQPSYFYDQAELSSKTIELNQGEVVASIEFPSNFYRVQKMSLYPSEVNFSLHQGQRLGSLGETPTLKLKVKNLLVNHQSIDENYQIELSKESDRLIFTGNFHEGQKVKLILSRWQEQKVYDIRVTNTPYSAMCLDLFNPDQVLENDFISIIKYINADSLKGTYHLYLEIDGEVYNLFQTVTFN